MLGLWYACSGSFELFAHARIPSVTEASLGKARLLFVLQLCVIKVFVAFYHMK